MSTAVWGLIACGGLFALAAAFFDWEWFMNSRKARVFVDMLGRQGARVFYGGLGVFLIGLGVAGMGGWLEEGDGPTDQQAEGFSPDQSDASGSAWQEFRYPAGNFAVHFPGRPQRLPGEMSGDPIQFGLETEEFGYVILYNDYPHITDVSADEVLDGACDGALEDVRQVLQRKNITLEGGHPGRAYAATDSEGDLIQGRVYLVRNRLYQTIVVTSCGRMNDPDTLRFLESFRLIDPVEAQVARDAGTSPPGPPGETPSPEPSPSEAATPSDPLDQALADLTTGDRHRYMRAAGQLAQRQPTEERREEIAQALVALLSDEDASVRTAALKALAVWHTEESIPEMAKRTEDQQFGVRWAAFDALGKVKNERAAEAVAAGLVGPERGRAGATLKAMGSLAEKAVAKYFRHDDVEVRRAALNIAKDIGTKQIIPDLIQALSDQDDGVRHAALEVLKKVPDEQAIVPVAQRLESDRDRGKAAECLKSMGPMVEETILKGLRHPNRDVVVECCKILETVGTQESLKDLARLTRSRDFFVRGAAQQAGRAIASRRSR
jgi:HEAT repeat protein